MNAVRQILRPIRWVHGVLFGAVLQRELRTSGRRRSTYIVRGGYAAIFAIGVLIIMASILGDSEMVSSTERTQALTMLTRGLVMYLTWFQFLFISLLSPALTSSSICDERRARTLITLISTPMTATQIIMGKLSGRLYQVVVLVLISAPLLLVLRIFGGVPVELILAFTALSLAVAVLGGTLGLMFSMWHTRAAPAAIYATLTLVLLLVTPAIVFYSMPHLGYFGLPKLGLSAAVINTFSPLGMATCPPITLLQLTKGGIVRTGLPIFSGTVFDRVWVLSTIYVLSVSVGMIMVAIHIFHKTVLDESIGKPQTKPQSKQARRRRNALNRLNTRPILWREAKQSYIGNRFYIIILWIVGGTGVAFAYVRMGFGDPLINLFVAFCGLIVLALISAVMSTGAIGSEREARSWDVLLTTPMSARQIILQKYFATLWRLWPILAFLIAHFILAVYFEAFPIMSAIEVLGLVIAPAVLFLATGLLMSLVLRSTIIAGILNIILLLALWLVVPVLLLGFLSFTQFLDSETKQRLSTILHVSSPPGMVAAMLDSSTAGPASRYSIAGHHVSHGHFTLYVLLNITAQLLLAILALAISITVFNRYAKRAS